MMWIEILKNKNGKWFWRLKAGNGKVLAHSEAYASKRNCRQTATKVKRSRLRTTRELNQYGHKRIKKM